MNNAAVIDRKAYEALLDEHHQLKIAYAGLQQQLSQLQKMIFGSRHERFVPTEAHPSQLSLGIEAEALAACSVSKAQQISYTKTKTSLEEKPLVHPGRMKLPEHLRREEIIVEPAEDITSCKKIGEEITEVLAYKPGELFVTKIIRPKYAKPDGDGVVMGRLPSRPLEKAMAGAGLLAQIVIDNTLTIFPCTASCSVLNVAV